MTANDSATYEWTVSGMDCASCAGKVRGAVERLPGVSDVDVALMTERLRLTLDEAQTPRDPVEATGSRRKDRAPIGKASCCRTTSKRPVRTAREMPQDSSPTLDRQGPRAVPVPVRVGIRPRRADW
mgnify:CR=1 FL=1